MGVLIVIDQVIRTRRKTIALIVRRDGSLVVRAPLRTTDETIRLLVEKKAGWITSRQELARSSYRQLKPKKYLSGEEFWYLGTLYPLEIIDRLRPPLELDGSFRLSRSALPKAAAVFERWYRQQAFQVLSERAQAIASRHGFSYKRIRISSARTRWGSCSSRGTLSFTWRLVMAPLPVIDYVVVHELVHLQLKNHSREFWRRVGTLMPDYKQEMEWLEANGDLLSL